MTKIISSFWKRYPQQSCEWLSFEERERRVKEKPEFNFQANYFLYSPYISRQFCVASPEYCCGSLIAWKTGCPPFYLKPEYFSFYAGVPDIKSAFWKPLEKYVYGYPDVPLELSNKIYEVFGTGNILNRLVFLAMCNGTFNVGCLACFPYSKSAGTLSKRLYWQTQDGKHDFVSVSHLSAIPDFPH